MAEYSGINYGTHSVGGETAKCWNILLTVKGVALCLLL